VPGADLLQGQGGRDTASYAEASGGVFVRLWSGEGLSGEALGDVLVGIENLRGSAFADTLVGDGGANELWRRRRGRALGRGWRRCAVGGAGNDVLTGRPAPIRSYSPTGGHDTIAGWEDGIDRLSFRRDRRGGAGRSERGGRGSRHDHQRG
jgi:Ca2+-binding RTX toxin-like protein